MARIDVPFNIKGQMIEQRPRVKIAAGGQNYFYAVFNLCGIWSNIDYKKAVFRRGSSTYMVDLVPSDSGDGMECLIPWEVMQEPGFFDTGIFGGSKLPTTMARTFVVEGCVGNGRDPQPPTPNWFSEIEKKLKQIDLLGIVNVYVCSEGEYIAGGSPTIAEPDKETFYLVPQDNEGFQYASWVYENDSWEFVDTLTITLDDDKVDETGSSMNITGAQVGQMVVVKAVDENGKPTEWEAVDTPKIPDNYLKYQIVDEVPTEQEEGVLYIVQTT